MLKLVLLITLALAAWPAAAAEFTVDSNVGNDGNAGTRELPLRTLEEAQRRARGGDTVILRGGIYPQFTESGAARALPVIYQAAEGTTPRISGLRLVNTNALRFHGIDFLSSSQTVVFVRGSRDIEIAGGQIHGRRWYISDKLGVYGVDIESSQDITISGVEIYEVHRGVQVQDTLRPVISDNEIRPKAGTGIQYLGGNELGTIHGNHIVGDTATGSALAQTAHASIISIRSSGVVISGNDLHGMGSSSGIMTYTVDGAGGEDVYSNIAIEGNYLYDTHPQAIRFYNMGDNIRVVGNIVAPGYRKVRAGRQCAPIDTDGRGVTCDSRYRFNTALVVHSVAKGYDGSGLRVLGNIMVGITNVPARATLVGNTLWSLQRGASWSPAGGQVLVGTHNAQVPLFENGTLFAAPINYHFPGNPQVDWALRK